MNIIAEPKVLANAIFEALHQHIAFYLSDYRHAFVQGWVEYQTAFRKV